MNRRTSFERELKMASPKKTSGKKCIVSSFLEQMFHLLVSLESHSVNDWTWD